MLVLEEIQTTSLDAIGSSQITSKHPLPKHVGMEKKTSKIVVSLGLAISLLYFFLLYLPNLTPSGVEISHLVKVAPSSGRYKRTILVGDIHGSLKPLQKLMEKVHYNSEDDKVIMLGDFISKGDHSIEVIEYAIENRMGCILGNHELNILKRYLQLHGLKNFQIANNTESDAYMEEYSFSRNYRNDDEMSIARKLEPHHIDYIVKCPIVQLLGPVPLKKKTTASGVAVHAGLLWNKDVYDQDPDDLTTVRSLLPPEYVIPTDDSSTPQSVSWSKMWKEHQGELPVKVFYGHDAKRGLNVKKFSVGLDSSCVYGGQLSCAVLEDGAQSIIQVDC